MAMETETTKELPAGFKLTEIGPVPEDWQVGLLGEALREANVRVREFGSRSASSFPILSLTRQHGLVPQSERFQKRIAIQDLSEYKVVRRGQIVYNPYVIWEGAVYMLRNYEHGLVSPVYPVWEARADKADAYFVGYLLRTPLALAAYNRLAAGAVNRRRAIRKNDFLSIQIPVPALDEQRAIASALSSVQRAIEATDRVIATTRQLRQSLMGHLFRHGPVPVADAESVPLKETGIGPIPQDWEEARLGDLLKSAQYGLSVRGNSAGAVPMLRMNNLTDGRVTTSELQYLNVDEDTLRKFKLTEGDILFNRTNSHNLVGKTSLFDLEGEYVFASYLIRLVTDLERLSPDYLHYYFNWDIAQIRLRTLASRGVSQSNISASKLKSFVIPLPPPDCQSEIVRALSGLDVKIQREENRKAALKELFRTMLHLLMTGKVRVKP